MSCITFIELMIFIYPFFHSNLWCTYYVPGTGVTYWDTKPNKADISVSIEFIIQLQIDAHMALLRAAKEGNIVLW